MVKGLQNLEGKEYVADSKQRIVQNEVNEEQRKNVCQQVIEDEKSTVIKKQIDRSEFDVALLDEVRCHD